MIGHTGATLRAIALTCVGLLLAGCSEDATVAERLVEGNGGVPPGESRLVTMPRPPILAAADPQDLPLARLNAARTRWNELYQRTDARRVSVEEMPFLTRTPEGQQFLAAVGPRALARGMPAEICPAALAFTPGGSTPLPDLVENTLSACLARVRPDHPDCGCRVLALGDFLTVPREEMSYATGTTARIHAPALGIEGVFVAEEEAGGTLVRDVRGPIARITRPTAGGAQVTFLDGGRVFTGRSIPVGYRRGRIAERIYATDRGGARLSLLIGFSPDELADSAAAWLAWPRGG